MTVPRTKSDGVATNGYWSITVHKSFRPSKSFANRINNELPQIALKAAYSKSEIGFFSTPKYLNQRKPQTTPKPPKTIKK